METRGTFLANSGFGKIGKLESLFIVYSSTHPNKSKQSERHPRRLRTPFPHNH